MDFSAGSLIASLIVSTVGFAIFRYGKSEVRPPQLAVGMAMMVYPYFIEGPLAMWGLAGALLAVLAVSVRLGY